ncbi:MAG TPA: hypothetical protein VJQ55_04300 [Candidatus Binatia bacterium]|nr:hypothetical protein [Candidatus Binatia bacterium]
MQKIYPIVPGIIAGFAGSVPLGFQLLEDMKHSLAAPKATRGSIMRWHRRARQIFKSAPTAWQNSFSQILVVGSHTRGRTRCIRMISPDFKPEIGTELSWLSIGSGAAHSEATAWANGYCHHTFLQDFGGLEIAEPHFGIARSMALNLAMDLLREPMSSVSNILQVGVVEGNTVKIETLGLVPTGPSAWRTQTLQNPLLQSWDDFSEAVSKDGLDCFSAVTSCSKGIAMSLRRAWETGRGRC